MQIETTGFILVVDDNTTNLSVLSQALKQVGWKVRVAMDGESALQKVQEERPELILLDVMMPGIDGFETCRRLKADAATHDIPVIFMTALSDTESKIKGLSIGAVDYIAKPFEQEEVIARVKIHLQLRQLQSNLAREVEKRTCELSATLEELQRSQQQLIQSEKLSTLGQLVAGVAHELNNPIGCIVSNIHPALETVSELEQVIRFYQQRFPEATERLEQELDIDVEFNLADLPKLLNSMQLSADRIQAMSVSLRSFSRSDSERKVRANLRDGLDCTLVILEHRLKANSIRPRIEVLKQYDDIFVECYPGPLSQVFMNLLANAIDALNEACSAAPQIQIQTEVTDKAAIVRIRDNGGGIPLEVQSQIFESTFTTKAAGKGTGLGLSISHQIIVEKHGGQLTCTSEMGQGTEFTISIPRL
ncbi:response regulator receiver sensor signal transduction histidine kinase [Leptolyngbya sp. NIES-3755]|nr:response regulator receiver sensor signal transduction histidine kinase [Leptolyngbya sp. NIES-3755]